MADPRMRAISDVGRGYYVFPVNVEVSEDGQKTVKPIARWREASTQNLEQIEKWWSPGSQWANAWVGIDCGKSGIVVIDCDPPDGIASWKAIAGDYPHAPVTTPRDGRHYYFRADPNRKIGIDNSGKIAKNVDVRGDGGFVFSYGWAAKPGQLPPVPEIVIERMGEKKESAQTAQGGGASALAPDETDVFGDAPGRMFTKSEAVAFVETNGLSALREAEVGTINAKTNTAAAVLSHFVPNFWTADEAYALLCDALRATAYDGKTWRVSRFKRVIDGREKVADPWVAYVTLEIDGMTVDEDGIERDEIDADADMVESVENTEHIDEPGEVDVRKVVGSGFFTDAKLAEKLAREVLVKRFLCTPAQGWFEWDGTVWRAVAETVVTEAVRKRVIARFDAELNRVSKDPDRGFDMATEWKKVLAAAKISNIVRLARGVPGVYIADEMLDRDPDLLNTPSGVVDLRTGEIGEHNPAFLMTKITRGRYIEGYVHPDWTMALEAIREDARAWLQTRVGQAVTGHPTPDGRLILLQGGGSNGKSAITTDGIVPALGDYASVASTKLFMAGEHSTERAELRGKRFLIAEELTEGRSIDVAALKQIQDVGTITARKLYKDNMTFQATHSLFVTTNYVPVVNETDHGTWRRLAMLRFPWRFLRPEETPIGAQDRPGDVGIKARIKASESGQHDAIVTWCVDGARRWYAGRFEGDRAMDLPESVEADTRLWRVSADRILGYATERLRRVEGACVLTVELIEDFNAWLAMNGHGTWSLETFKSRFEQHEVVIGWGVTAKQTRDLSKLSRRGVGPEAPSPARARVFWNLAFRPAYDPAEELEP